ncbi:Hypothetical protein CINCED_3A008912 [Cinara cedri]|uniref:WAP domain-containing protein n=1 Tax=Cinara cedri TaxID=506608 RepID=A0A5E4MEG8_9HEMI|nr:Hypothetical protein CINCED_3A008912 [Cinara cedri]
MRDRFVLLSALALLLPAVLRAAVVPKSGIRSENDNGDSVNSLEDVDLGCDGAAKCDQDQDAVGAAAAVGIGGVQSTTKNPIINIFQLTNKSCPGFELPSIFNRQKCDTDRDCWPRICCGYGGLNGTRYCRIPLPSWRNDLLKTVSKILVPTRFLRPAVQPQ